MELLKIEFFKIKKSPLLYASFLAPIAIVIMYIRKAESFDLNGLSMNKVLVLLSTVTFIAFVLPLLSIYAACLITKVENDNHGWKQLMLLPIKKSSIYFTKYKSLFLTLGISILSYLLSSIIGGFYISKEIDFSILLLGIEIFITSLPIIILLFIIGRKFTSVIPVISAGILIMITNIFIAQSRFWIYAPWTYPLSITAGDISSSQRYIALSVSLVLSILMILFDYINFKKSDVM